MIFSVSDAPRGGVQVWSQASLPYSVHGCKMSWKFTIFGDTLCWCQIQYILIQIFLENFGKFLLICLKLQNNLILTLLNNGKKTSLSPSFLPHNFFLQGQGGGGGGPHIVEIWKPHLLYSCALQRNKISPYLCLTN
jgi:hypothetical protein